MERLDVNHHKIITLTIILLTLLTGILFGVKISGASRGTDGLLIIVFAVCFLTTTMGFVMLMQLVHIRDELRILLDAKAPAQDRNGPTKDIVEKRKKAGRNT